MFCWLRLDSFMTKKSFSLNIEAKIKHTQNVAFFFVCITPESTVQEALGYHYFGYGLEWMENLF